jgi:hypothetical protein
MYLLMVPLKSLAIQIGFVPGNHPKCYYVLFCFFSWLQKLLYHGVYMNSLMNQPIILIFS